MQVQKKYSCFSVLIAGGNALFDTAGVGARVLWLERSSYNTCDKGQDTASGHLDEDMGIARYI